MTARHTRRAVLGVLGAAAAGGCLDLGTGFDPGAANLDPVFERAAPSPPQVLPVSLGSAYPGTVRSRVADLLDPVPEPLSRATVPNGAVRTAVIEEREAARSALQTMAEADGPLAVLEAGIRARTRAATCAGAWALLSTRDSPSRLQDTGEESGLTGLDDAIPGPAGSPQAGVVVYAVPERWLRDSRTGDPPETAGAVPPIAVGRAVGADERTRARIDAGHALRDRYEAGLEAASPVESDLVAATEALGPVLDRRLRAGFGGSVPERHVTDGTIEAVVGESVARDRPRGDLLADRLDAILDALADRPTAMDPASLTYPALSLRVTHRVLAALGATRLLADRIASRDRVSVEAVATVRRRREAAIEAIETLAGDASPLESWQVRRLLASLAVVDSRLQTVDQSAALLERVTVAYGWHRMLAEAVPDATGTVTDAF